MHHQVVNYRIWDGSQCRLAIAGFPGVPHPGKCLAAAQPTMKLGIHRHVEIRRNGKPRTSPNYIGIFTRTHKYARNNLFSCRVGACGALMRPLVDALQQYVLNLLRVDFIATNIDNAAGATEKMYPLPRYFD